MCNATLQPVSRIVGLATGGSRLEDMLGRNCNEGVYVCMYECMYVFMNVCTYVCIYVCTYVRSTCMYIFI
jgi:hypothetical protein